MPKLMSWRSAIIAFITFCMGLFVGLAIAIWWVVANPPSPLTKGLSSDFKAASVQFDQRVRARFPVGTTSWDLVRTLEAEGFRATWFEANGEYGAKRSESDFPCTINAQIYWRGGQNGVVTAIRGTYGENGCL